MAMKKQKLIDIPISDFYEELKGCSNYYAQKARLIPSYKLGDEMALTSVFLSSLRVINEFRKMIFSNLNISANGKIHIFTEMTFKQESEKRIDGFICIERGGKIIDSALLEMKNGKSQLEEKQINDYIEIADKFEIPKLITVSNQFVSHPTQCPLNIIKKRKVSLYHLSWSYILTIAHILLIDNDTNIEDQDQVEIMKEVVDYFEHPKSGVIGFTSMKDGWKNTVERIIKGETLKNTDKDVIEAVESWIQEEKDMALILSKQLGVLVGTNTNKYKNDFMLRIEDLAKSLVSNNYLESVFKINGAASNLTVKAKFLRRTVEFSTQLIAPQDKATIKGQIGWIKKQIQRMQTKNPEIYEQLKNDILISIKLKNFSGEERKSFDELDIFALENKSKFIKEYGVILNCDLGRDFSSKNNIIKKMEDILIKYYDCVVLHLEKWHKPAPEIKPINNNE